MEIQWLVLLVLTLVSELEAPRACTLLLGGKAPFGLFLALSLGVTAPFFRIKAPKVLFFPKQPGANTL